MPKVIEKAEFQKIQHIINQHPEGLGIRDITRELEARFKLKLERRTLVRRLASMIEARRVTSTGKGMSYIYHPIPAHTFSVQEPEREYWKNNRKVLISCNEESEAIAQQVTQPLLERKAVSYKSQLLEQYQPNETFYLPSLLRQHLFNLGKTSDTDRQRTAGSYVHKILQPLLVDFSWASSRLERNSYSLIETRNLLELNKVAEGKNAEETRMILNHKDAIYFMVEEAEKIDFNAHTFFTLHALLSKDLLPDNRYCGRLRQHIVKIGGSTFHPLTIPQKIEEYFQLILKKAKAIQDPFEQSFFIMVHIPYLQPFLDVNKRVSRLSANIPLIKNNLCPLSFIDVPEEAYVEGYLGVYELNRLDLLRDVFLWAYERSCEHYITLPQIEVHVDPFQIEYVREIEKTIQHIVLNLRPIDKNIIHEFSLHLVPDEARDKFVTVILTILETLHEYNCASYRLKMEEYYKWLDTK